MQIIPRSIALLIALCVTGQNLLWATQPPGPSLKEVQQQARQDAAFLSTKGIVVTAASIPIVYSISRFVYQQMQEKKDLQLQQKALKKEVARLRNANITLNKWVLDAEQTQHALERFIRFSNQTPVDVNKDVAKYVDIANTHLTKEAREDLFQQMLREPWFKAFSDRDKRFFYDITHNIMEQANFDCHLPLKKQMDLIWTWTPQFTETDLTLASKYLRGLCRQITNKPNLFFASALLLGIFTIQDVSAHTASHDMAKRLNQNFQLFLQADEQTLTELEQDPITYEVCVKNAALIHALRESEPEVLDNLRPLVSAGVPKLRSVTAR